MDNSLNQSSVGDLSHSISKQLEEMKAKFTELQLDHSKLKAELKQEKEEGIVAQQNIKKLEAKLAKQSPVFRKSLSELTDPVYLRKRKEELQQQLGKDYQITKVDHTPSLTKSSYLAFKRIFRLTRKAVNALSKLSGSNWPTDRQLSYHEDQVVEECGGFVEHSENEHRMIWAADPAKFFFHYLEHLQNTYWNGDIPKKLKVVVSADKG